MVGADAAEHPIFGSQPVGEAPGTIHPLDDEWYMYEATNGMKFNLPKRYTVKEELGTGSYAAVLSADDQVTGEVIAIKKCDQLFRHPEDGKRVLREIKLLQFFDHPNLVKIRGLLPPRSPTFLDVYILTEFLDMDLKELLQTVGPLDEESCQSIMYQVTCGLNYIHSAEVIHRDLKPDNILLNVKNNSIVAKICDFNLSRQMQRRDMTREVVSAAYRPPELLLQAKAGYNSAVDLWSMGCIQYEMVTAKQLFPGKKPKHTLCRVLSTIPLPPFSDLDWLTHESQTFLRKNCPPLRTTVQAKLHGRMSATGIQLVNKLLMVEPGKRPTAAEVLKHPYLKKMQNPNNEAIANKKFQWPSDRVNLSATRLRTMFWMEMLGSESGTGLPRADGVDPVQPLPPPSTSMSPMPQYGLGGSGDLPPAYHVHQLEHFPPTSSSPPSSSRHHSPPPSPERTVVSARDYPDRKLVPGLPLAAAGTYNSLTSASGPPSSQRGPPSVRSSTPPLHLAETANPQSLASPHTGTTAVRSRSPPLETKSVEAKSALDSTLESTSPAGSHHSESSSSNSSDMVVLHGQTTAPPVPPIAGLRSASPDRTRDLSLNSTVSTQHAMPSPHGKSALPSPHSAPAGVYAVPASPLRPVTPSAPSYPGAHSRAANTIPHRSHSPNPQHQRPLSQSNASKSTRPASPGPSSKPRSSSPGLVLESWNSAPSPPSKSVGSRTVGKVGGLDRPVSAVSSGARAKPSTVRPSSTLAYPTATAKTRSMSPPPTSLTRSTSYMQPTAASRNKPTASSIPQHQPAPQNGHRSVSQPLMMRSGYAAPPSIPKATSMVRKAPVSQRSTPATLAYPSSAASAMPTRRSVSQPKTIDAMSRPQTIPPTPLSARRSKSSALRLNSPTPSSLSTRRS
uniref:Protein kinase domain-containing protein n=1 Tax=Eutreptiella gymnastica TaxID=73025 RepID=A0A7S1IXI5_9EUGL|mmetsp:Transcript_49257/g.87950  ORF Transcript_49257/g.87950 Transcript_49257/m.87950 type:complete len:901 (+) Transcript_49257:48-2750(+)